MTTPTTHPTPVTLPVDQLKAMASQVAAELAAVANARATPAATGGGSLHRGISEELRSRFIIVRAALFTRGIYDPVLVRFDTATAPQASTADVAEQLAKVVASF
jgi:hypothetical protein